MPQDDLSKPRGVRARPFYDPDAFGRFSEAIARFLGTGRYLAGQTIIVIVWIAVNVAVVALRFDPYPFILLNLAFSTQAAYAAPLILLAQNRQADRDKSEIERDREANARSRADMDYLAREIAAIRIALESKADRDDMAEIATRLDQPKSKRQISIKPSFDPDAFGRVSEQIARFFGTARYLVIQTATTTVWMTRNRAVPRLRAMASLNSPKASGS